MDKADGRKKKKGRKKEKTKRKARKKESKKTREEEFLFSIYTNSQSTAHAAAMFTTH